MELLILFRLLQGAAGAFLVPGALSIITATFAGEERGRAIGLWAASTSILTTIGPLVGGLLIQAVSWRAAFLVNLPLVLVALVALRRVPESRDEQASGRVDWLGAVVARRRGRRPRVRADPWPGAGLAGPGGLRGPRGSGRSRWWPSRS